MSENIRDTLTSSDLYSMHTSIFIILLYESCTITISAYSEFTHLENYTHVIDALSLICKESSFIM